MLRFQDHPIKIIVQENWLFAPKSEEVDETLLRINNWIEENEYIVLNIETLIFPALDTTTQGTGSAVFKASTDTGTNSKYYQVFRVWYKENKIISSSEVENLV